MEIGLLSALVGGVLALLSPCGALLLPAYFASSVGSGLRLAVHSAVFYLGLLLTLVPLGLGLGALGSLVTEHRQTLVLVTAVLLVGLGLAQMAGFGFDLSRVIPGASSLQAGAAARTGLPRSLLLGAASGVAGVCAGPILGAILTLAVASGDTLSAGLLLAVYGAGMVIPLVLLAATWHRMGSAAMTLLRGRGFTVLGRELHTTSVVTGALILAVGVLFWTTNGLVEAPSLVPVAAQAWIQERLGMFANPVVDVVAVLLAGGLFLLWWHRRERVPHEDRQAVSR
jgi:cytochrome c biogenesis protein CcdA